MDKERFDFATGKEMQRFLKSSFRHLRKISKNDCCLRHVHSSFFVFVRPHGTTRLPLDGSSRNLVIEQAYFSKTCREVHVSLIMTRITGSLRAYPSTVMIISRSNENCFREIFRECQNTRVMFNNLFFENHAFFFR